MVSVASQRLAGLATPFTLFRLAVSLPEHSSGRGGYGASGSSGVAGASWRCSGSLGWSRAVHFAAEITHAGPEQRLIQVDFGDSNRAPVFGLRQELTIVSENT